MGISDLPCVGNCDSQIAIESVVISASSVKQMARIFFYGENDVMVVIDISFSPARYRPVKLFDRSYWSLSVDRKPTLILNQQYGGIQPKGRGITLYIRRQFKHCAKKTHNNNNSKEGGHKNAQYSIDFPSQLRKIIHNLKEREKINAPENVLRISRTQWQFGSNQINKRKPVWLKRRT